MADRIFIDSNVWLYLFLKDNDEKYKSSEAFFVKNSKHSTFIITYQIVNEVSNILLKNKYTESEIKENIEHLLKICTIQDFTKDIVLCASTVREKYSLSFWDSIVVGSALFSECSLLVSEDMQDGLIIDDKLAIKNIFNDKGTPKN